MIFAILFSLFLFIRLRQLKYLIICYLPLIFAQNELWLSDGSSLGLSSLAVILNISWLILLGKLARRHWNAWNSQSSKTLNQLKG